MPENFDIGSHVSRILILLFAIIAGSLIGSLFLGRTGSLIGACVGFIIAILLLVDQILNRQNDWLGFDHVRFGEGYIKGKLGILLHATLTGFLPIK